MGSDPPNCSGSMYELQKKVVRTVTLNKKYTHITPFFHNLRLLKINEIHSLKLLCFVHDRRQGSPLQPFSDYFILVHSIHDHNTQQASKGDTYISSIYTAQYGKRTTKFLFVPKLIKVCL